MKIGTIGSGFIVDMFIEAARLVDNVSIEAVYSRSESSAKAYAEKMGVNKYYFSLEEMLNDDSIDTIYVASPNSLHYAHSVQALQAKKHVITEKPFASNVKELDHMIALAKESKVFLWEAITNIYTPNLNIIKEQLHKAGTIKQVVCNFCKNSRKYAEYKEGAYPNVFTLEYSGGSLMDLNLYNVHVCMHLFGKPKNFQYFPNLGRNGIDTSGVLIFQYEDFVATLIAAKDSTSDDMINIQGDAGTFTINEASPGVCKHVSFAQGKETPTTVSITQRDEHMFYEVEAFQEMFANNDYDRCYQLLEYSRDVLEVIETARKNAHIYFDADQ